MRGGISSCEDVNGAPQSERARYRRLIAADSGGGELGGAPVPLPDPQCHRDPVVDVKRFPRTCRAGMERVCAQPPLALPGQDTLRESGEEGVEGLRLIHKHGMTSARDGVYWPSLGQDFSKHGHVGFVR